MNDEKNLGNADRSQTEVNEFVSNETKDETGKDKKPGNAKKRKAGRNIRRMKRKSEEQVLALAGFVLMLLIYIIVGSVACKISLVLVCVIALLDAILARCFYDLPVWVHLVVVLLIIGVGAYINQAIFAILAAIVYFTAVILLCYFHHLVNVK